MERAIKATEIKKKITYKWDIVLRVSFYGF